MHSALFVPFCLFLNLYKNCRIFGSSANRNCWIWANCVNRAPQLSRVPARSFGLPINMFHTGGRRAKAESLFPIRASPLTDTALSCTLKMEAACSFETSVNSYIATESSPFWCSSASYVTYFNVFLHFLCDFDRASSLICGNKMPTRCNRGFYCRYYCLLNMFRAPLCPSSGAQEYYTVVAACGISCCGFQVAGLVWN